MFRKADVRMES